MKIRIACLLFALLTAISGALADSAEIPLNGEIREVTILNGEIEGDVMSLRVAGFDTVGDQMITAPAWIYIIVDGAEIQAKSAENNGDGSFTYKLDCGKEPDLIYIFADGVENKPQQLWINPDYESELKALELARTGRVTAQEVVVRQPEPTQEPETKAASEPETTPEPEQTASETEPVPEQTSLPETMSAPQTDDKSSPVVDEVYQAAYDVLSTGRILKKGSIGEKVKSLQILLNSYGEALDVDGVIGPMTLAALNRVQTYAGIPETETVNLDTFLYLIDHIPESADMSYEAPLQEASPALIDMPGMEIYRGTYNDLQKGIIISEGMINGSVRGVQTLLTAFGETIEVDGIFGPITLEALHHVEKACSMPRTDTVDLDTFTQLLEHLINK